MNPSDGNARQSAYEVVSNGSQKFDSASDIDKKLEKESDFKEAYSDTVVAYTGSKPKESSQKDAVMTLMKAYVGSGILALPYAFSQGGWLLSTVIFVLSCLVLMKCVNLAVEAIEKCE